MPRYRTQPTPNPNSLKITSAGRRFIEDGLESFNTASDAEGHPLGHRLFNVTGVANVFIVPQFLTITKHPAADWDEVLTGVEAALDQYFAEAQGAL